MESVCVAFKAHMGWVNAVVVAISTDTPNPIHAQRIDLLDGKDRETLEPYHVAGGWSGLKQVPRPSNPAAVIRRGRRKQVTAAKKRLSALRESLEREDLQWSRAVVLTSRGWLGEDLEHVLGSHVHIHIAEGEAIRDATRAALKAMNIEQVDQDEKRTLTDAGHALGHQDCDSLMKGLRPPGAKSWAREERLIALAAWLNRN
ncbi:MAG: hypothetical protein O7B25_06250, partial [Gammaproteobacteria bacterium]|nr:hypothetical protein [Gammaproteobacteria bacterium]